MWKKKYEIGQDVSPDQDIVDKLCAFFGCSEVWLRGITEEKEKAADPKVGGDDESLEDIIPGYDSLTEEFQSTPLMRGATCFFSSSVTASIFQSTPPMRGATVGEFFLIASKWQPFVGLTFGV